jgi:hypothetical protein
MSEEFDPFAPGSNLKENFDGAITSVKFEKQENGDNYTAHMIVHADDGDEPEMFLSLGRDWVSYDGGRSVEHPRGNNTKFNAQTTYSEFIVFAMGGFSGDAGDENERPVNVEKGLGAAQVMRERNRQLDNRGPQMADLWLGLRFHFDVVKRKSRQRVVTKTETGDKVEWTDGTTDRMLPVRFLGVQGVQQAMDVTATAPTSSPTPASSPSPPPTSGNVSHPALASLSPEDQEKIRALARGTDFGGFVDGVMGLQTSNGSSMLEIPPIIQALADESFYVSLRT